MQFVEKAPTDVVLGVKEKATEAKEKIDLTQKRLLLLESMAPISR